MRLPAAMFGLFWLYAVLLAFADCAEQKAEKPEKDKTTKSTRSCKNDSLSLRELESKLEAYGPNSKDQQERWSILTKIDTFLAFSPWGKKKSADYVNPAAKPEVIAFYQRQVTKGLNALEKTRVKSGVACLKLYSSTWVVKSSRNVVVFDFCEGPIRNITCAAEDDKQERNKIYRKFHCTDAQRKQLARMADIYISSHWHFDHLSYSLAKEMTALGKSVFVTPQTKRFWRNKKVPFVEQLKTIEEDKTVTEAGVSFCAFRGAQYMKWLDAEHRVPDPKFKQHAECYCTLLRMGGVTLMHFGDNNSLKALPWTIKKKKEGWKVDIILMAGQARNRLQIEDLWPNADKAMTHDHEFTHPTWQTFAMHKKRAKYVLVWGEIFLYKH